MANETMGAEQSTRGLGPWVLLLVLITGAVLFRVVWADFIDFDDDLYVANNPHVLNGLTGTDVEWAFTTTRGGNWCPATWWSLQLDATISGPPPVTTGGSTAPPPRPSPRVYHVDNLLEHLGATLLLFLLLDRATKRRWASFAVALLWGIHPLRVESVAWVTERKDVLAMLFGFLAIYLYIRWTERRGWLMQAGIYVCLIVSLLAKPLFVTLPCILLLLDVWPLKRVGRSKDLLRRVVEKWGLLLIVVVMSGIALYAQKSIQALSSLEEIGLGPRVENAILSYVRYLWMQVSFSRLGIFYPYLGRATAMEIAGAVLVLAGVSILCWWQRRARPWLPIGWLWYLGTLVPLIGIVQIGQQAYADRYTYLPSVGLLVMVVFSVPAAMLQKKPQWWWINGTLGGVAVILGMFTVRQLGFWENAIELEKHTVAVTKSNYVMYSALGSGYMRIGRPDLAFQAYQESIRIFPQEKAQIGLGALYLMMRQPQEASKQFAGAVESAPNDATAHNLYGIALASSGRLDGAIEEFEEAVRLDPADRQFRENLQRALAAHLQQEQAASRPMP